MREFLLDVELVTDNPFNVELGNEELSGFGPKSYNNLDDLPMLDGETIIGNMHEKDPTVPEWAKKPTKPIYTPKDIGAVAEEDMRPLTAADFEEMWNNL